MGITADVTQVYELGHAIGQSSRRIGARISDVVRKAGADCEAQAKGMAPVDTGALRNSIGTDVQGDGRSGSMTVDVGPTVDYAVYQEFGTYKMAAHPFMIPAHQSVEPGFVAACEALTDGVL